MFRLLGFACDLFFVERDLAEGSRSPMDKVLQRLLGRDVFQCGHSLVDVVANDPRIRASFFFDDGHGRPDLVPGHDDGFVGREQPADGCHI